MMIMLCLWQGVHGRLRQRCALLLAWLRLHWADMGSCGSSCQGQVCFTSLSSSALLAQVQNWSAPGLASTFFHTQPIAEGVSMTHNGACHRRER